jgi:hypothetical protein
MKWQFVLSDGVGKIYGQNFNFIFNHVINHGVVTIQNLQFTNRGFN